MHCPVCEQTAAQHFIQVEGRDYWRCCNCEATFLEPAQLPTQREEHAQYRLHNNNVEDAGYRQFLSRLAQPLLERLPAKSEGLDYGCGPGPALAAMLREAGHTVSLYDPLFYPEAAVLAKQYDFITCTEVVEHFHQPAQMFFRLNKLLRPGGWLGVMTNLQTDDAAFANWHYRRDPTHVVFYRLNTFKHIAAQHGWDYENPGQNVIIMRKRVA